LSHNIRKKQRAVVCTSTIQVLIGRAAMNVDCQDGYQYVDHLFIFHPNLTGAEEKIIALAKQAGYDHTYDFSKEIRSISNLLRLRRSNKICDLNPSSTNKTIQKYVSSMKQNVSDLEFQEIYCRKAREWEKFGIINILDRRYYHCIEDGIGNYTNANKLAPLSLKRRIRNKYSHHLKWAFNRTRGINNLYIRHLITRNFESRKVFMVHYHNGSQSIGDALKIVLERVSKLRTKKYDNVKALILGTMYSSLPRLRISTDQEIELYKKAISLVKKRHKVNETEIGFKPHPRFGVDPVSLQRRLGFNITIVEDDFGIAETEFTNPQLEVVYSFGSTASINAHNLFGLTTWFIKWDGLSRDEKQLWILETAAKCFGIETIDLE